MKINKQNIWGISSAVTGALGILFIFGGPALLLLEFAVFNSDSSIVNFVISVVMGILSIVFYIIQRKKGNTGLSKAGLVLGIIVLSVVLLLIIIFSLSLLGRPLIVYAR